MDTSFNNITIIIVLIVLIIVFIISVDYYQGVHYCGILNDNNKSNASHYFENTVPEDCKYI